MADFDLRFRIRHSTTYTYARPVGFNPHLLRFLPRSDAAQQVLSFELHVDPLPDGQATIDDAEENTAHHVWFDGEFDRMQISATSEVQTLRSNPFDFLVYAQNRSLPIGYSAPERFSLMPYVQRRPQSASLADPVAELAANVLQQSENRVVEFLMNLTRHLADKISSTRRETGVPRLPHETLALKDGACRDTSVLMIDACRSVGLAARFVSGYQEGIEPPDSRDLHARVEVYLPGGGWRGFDPTHGLAVADRHVAVAASVSPAYTTPVIGTLQAEYVPSKMTAEIEIDILDETE
ncbi:MAG: transglutaminase family protein [Planctomycetota bacterium]